jgi:hypothetical protein
MVGPRQTRHSRSLGPARLSEVHQATRTNPAARDPGAVARHIHVNVGPCGRLAARGTSVRARLILNPSHSPVPTLTRRAFAVLVDPAHQLVRLRHAVPKDGFVELCKDVIIGHYTSMLFLLRRCGDEEHKMCRSHEELRSRSKFVRRSFIIQGRRIRAWARDV